ncbi:MAG: 50S ribosomal protein L6 [Clostridia bacterium]|nr:50S ribosomal protein L6 [Clostridia bacterium]MCL6521245.1 50S ribosomal protein L6 [Bacillota bacterium]
MSRVGKQPIPIPAGVQVTVEGRKVVVRGPRGELEQELPGALTASVEDGQVVVRRPDDERRSKALHGLTRTLIANMVQGVSQGFERTLEITGTGYRASVQGRRLVLAVGYSHPVEIDPPEGVTIEAPNPTTIVVRGADKQKVGQVAADIRAVRKPEPYLGKGIHYAGERIRRKAGKTGK